MYTHVSYILVHISTICSCGFAVHIPLIYNMCYTLIYNHVRYTYLSASPLTMSPSASRRKSLARTWSAMSAAAGDHAAQ